ncbi:restriction endonuclease subunit S [Nitrosococcus wardiae]|uniref:Restriction endonuclease subunit S n=2 Tax=Nitrosococcus wardiae TaxID=1814290 RepID=A0A4V1AWE9_9GAMM|nr:restriction endonuclease subunit S [Nitrosococcus wardiae]
MPKYQAYKDSGMEWIGEVPAHWDVVTLGSILKPVSIKNCPELPLLSITREQGVILRNKENKDENHNFIPDDLSNYKLVEEGQFGINKMKAWQGSYGVSEHIGIVSPAYYVFSFLRHVNPRFFHLAIRSKLYISFFASASDGVRIGQWDLSKTRMKEIPFLMPSMAEQTAIATFLDRKTAQIDQAASIKERQIALLKERKQILIQNAVTRGLNSDAPMRDSGVEWIGEIPAHWGAMKLKYLFKEVNERTKTGKEVLFSLRMEQGLIPHDEVSDKFISDENLVDYKIVRPGQMVMNRMRAAIGIFGLVAKHGLVSPDYAVFEIDAKAHPEFFLRLFKLPLLGTQFRLNSKGLGTGSSGFMRLYTENFGDIKVAVPPKEEQIAIVSHIETESAKLDKGITLLQQQIAELKEYKAILINSAVTGKIKVPGVEEPACKETREEEVA